MHDILLALGAIALLAQAPQQAEPTFRVQVDAVEVDAFVADAQVNPVTDLTIDDFEIIENGRPQTITSSRSMRTQRRPPPTP